MHIYDILRKIRKTRGGEKSSGRELVVDPAWLDGGREIVGSRSSFCPSSVLKGPLWLPHNPQMGAWELRLEHALAVAPLPEMGVCCRWWSMLADFFCLFMGPGALVLSYITCVGLGSSFHLVTASSGIQYLKKTMIPIR